jgi:hypothetical protein
MPVQLDKEKAKKNIEVILDKLHNDTDFVLLKEYKKLFKKEISIFRHMDAAAWLFMYYNNKENPNLQLVKKEKQVPSRPEETAASVSSPEVEVILSEEESKRLFISIGKNRRLYPRELITIISSKTSAVREDIGNIRILDNYSFVQVRDTKADEIINALNGVKIRGRTLTVNYAKPKVVEQ